MTGRPSFFTAVLVLLLAVAPAFSQGTITSPVTINLVPELLLTHDGGLGGWPHYKYGIYASLAGSTNPQLYEFDTGGTGFYAVYSTNAGTETPAWGITPTVLVDSNGGAVSYTSGNTYSGPSVSTTVTLYSADGGGTPSPSVTSGAVIVGQTTTITNARDTPPTLWPTNTAPIPNNFYGDFGLGLGYATNSIMNVLAQLNYSNGVLPGFIVHLGAQPTDTNTTPSASVQIGLTANDLAAYPIKVYLNGSNATTPFANGLPTYAQAALASSLTMSNAIQGAATFTMPVVIDSGATPTMHYTNTATDLTPYFNNGINGGGVTNGTPLSLMVTMTNGIQTNLFTALTGNTAPDIGVATTMTNVFGGGLYDFNVGEQLFYQYNVAYDLQDGIIAFQPISVPEPKSCWMLLLGTLILTSIVMMRGNHAQS